LFVNEEGIIKMVDDSTCEVIGTEKVKVTEREEMMRALKAVQYISKTQCYLISIRVLNEKGGRIQVQQGVVIVSQGEKC